MGFSPVAKPAIKLIQRFQWLPLQTGSFTLTKMVPDKTVLNQKSFRTYVKD
jgi:hypothetical protein